MAAAIHYAGLQLIKDMEGLRLKAYHCPAGVLTIGYGHTGPDVKPGQIITLEVAHALLKRDLEGFANHVDRVAPVATPYQRAAMVSLCYNIGTAAFDRSSVLRNHNAGKHTAAAQAFGKWVRANGRVMPGLVKRRVREAGLYRITHPLPPSLC